MGRGRHKSAQWMASNPGVGSRQQAAHAQAPAVPGLYWQAQVSSAQGLTLDLKGGYLPQTHTLTGSGACGQS